MQGQVKTYRGTERSATNEFRRDAARMASRGLVPTSQTWAPGSYGAGSFILALLFCFLAIGFFVILYMLIVKPAGTLTVTYAVDLSASSGSEEKTCPQCAETVKRAALVCRFCGHAFPEIEQTAVSPVAAHETVQRSAAFDFGAWFGSMWPRRWFKVTVIAIPFVLFAQLKTFGAMQTNEATSTKPLAQVNAASSASGDAANRERCRVSRADQLANYRRLMQVGKQWDAAGTIRACASTLDDSELKKLLADAEIQSYKQTIGSAKASKEDRLEAMQSLVRDYPEAGKPYESKITPLGLQIAREEASAEATRRRHVGVHIGMSQAEVLQSNWGKPESVNRTITANGKHEQWVYAGGYLYFDDGVLTSIQN